MKLRLLATLAALALPVAAQAQDDPMCRNGLFAREAPFTLARVNVDRNVYFHEDMDGCPSAGQQCVTSSYLVGGDEVIVSKMREGFACAYYEPSGTAGWIRLDRIELVPTEGNPEPEAWTGAWHGLGDNTLTITHAGRTRLQVEGMAFWPSREPTPRYSVHVGEISGRIEHIGNRGRYDDVDLCEVNFTLLGHYLLAGDNGKCGGANVSFTGVYTRAEG